MHPLQCAFDHLVHSIFILITYVLFFCAITYCKVNYFIYRLLLSIDRRQSINEAYDTISLATEYHNTASSQGRVVGIDLSGDPKVMYFKFYHFYCIVIVRLHWKWF